jgi:hypothetical protein
VHKALKIPKQEVLFLVEKTLLGFQAKVATVILLPNLMAEKILIL